MTAEVVTSAAPVARTGIEVRVRLRRALAYAAALTLLVAAYELDLVTGNEVSSSLFYVAPVAFAARFLGRTPGLLVAVGAAGAWLAAQFAVGVTVSRPGILFWNVSVEAAIYLGVAAVTARVHADRDAERRLTAQVLQANDVLDREARAVGKLQRDLLPRELPTLPGWRWACHYVTSTRAGGDYYDAIPLPDGRIALLVADATGHGAPAAVLVAMARALLRSRSTPPSTPEGVLDDLNRQLATLLPPGWFLTACCVVLDPESGWFTYALAGHEPPLRVRAGRGAVEPLPASGGPPLGPFAWARYGAGQSRLAPGDTLVLYTDGITEAMDAERELFGLERLRRALAAAADATPEQALARVLAAVAAHAGGTPPADDATVLLLRRDAAPAAAGAN